MNEGADASIGVIEIVEDQARELLRQLYLISGSKNQKDISYSQYKAMSVIYNDGPISVGRLERLIGSAQSTTSEMVARLTKAGLVAKVRGPLDGRVVKVELTDQGHELLHDRRRRVRESYRSLFGKLSPAQQEKFIDSVRYLNDLLSYNAQ
jgi:DNA-binding MarR family transcriptional regulator